MKKSSKDLEKAEWQWQFFLEKSNRKETVVHVVNEQREKKTSAVDCGYRIKHRGES